MTINMKNQLNHCIVKNIKNFKKSLEIGQAVWYNVFKS